MVWIGIGLYSKLGPVVFQNLGPGRGNGVTAALYINEVLNVGALLHSTRLAVVGSNPRNGVNSKIR